MYKKESDAKQFMKQYGPSIMSGFTSGAMQGGIAGGIAGASTADDDDKLLSAIKGALVGAGIGGLSGATGNAISGSGRNIFENFKRFYTGYVVRGAGLGAAAGAGAIAGMGPEMMKANPHPDELNTAIQKYTEYTGNSPDRMSNKDIVKYVMEGRKIAMKKQLNYDELATVCLERHGLGIDHPAVKEAGMRDVLNRGKQILSQGKKMMGDAPAMLDDFTVAALQKLKMRFGGQASNSLKAVRNPESFIANAYKAIEAKGPVTEQSLDRLGTFVRNIAPEDVKKLHDLQAGAAVGAAGLSGVAGGAYMLGKEAGVKEVVNTVDDVIIKALSKLKGKAGQVGTRLSRSSRAVANEGKFIDDATKGLVGLQQSDFRTLGGIAQNAGDDMKKLHTLEAILGGAGIVGTGAAAYGATS